MAGLVPAIHVLRRKKAWMPGTRPGMTNEIPPPLYTRRPDLSRRHAAGELLAWRKARGNFDERPHLAERAGDRGGADFFLLLHRTRPPPARRHGLHAGGTVGRLHQPAPLHRRTHERGEQGMRLE